MEIGFEAKRVFSNFTGLGNYGRFVVSALADHAADNRYLLFTPRVTTNPDTRLLLEKQNIRAIEPRGVFRMATSIWRSWGMSFAHEMKSLHIFHGLSQELPLSLPSSVKKVVTVHDLIFLRYPQFYHAWDAYIYKAKVIRACAVADVIVAISEQTKQDLVDLLKVPAEKIHVIYQGCHPNFRRKADDANDVEVRKKYQLPANYILNVGTVEERKNVAVLIKALGEMAPGDRLPIVIVGKHTAYIEEVKREMKRFQLEAEVTFLANASFVDFPAIYRGATVFVYPSLFEGFGIPLVEAIECGIPVVTSLGSCFSEAAGPASTYIDPYDSAALGKALTELIRNAEKRKAVADQSREYARRFDPSEIAREMMGLYRSL